MVELVFSLRAFLPLCFHLPLPCFLSLLFFQFTGVCPYSQCLFTHLFLPLGRPTVHSFKNNFSLYIPHPSFSPLAISLHLLRVTVCSFPLSAAFPSIPPSVILPPTLHSTPSPSTLTTPRLLLFCRNNKAAGGRVFGHGRGNWLFMALFW